MVWFWIHKLGQSVTISLKWCGQEMCHVPCAQCPVPMTLETSNLNTVILKLVLVWLLMELLVADSQVTTINLSNWILSYFRWSKTAFFFSFNRFQFNNNVGIKYRFQIMYFEYLVQLYFRIFYFYFIIDCDHYFTI